MQEDNLSPSDMEEKPPGKYNAADLEVIFLVQYTALGSACFCRLSPCVVCPVVILERYV